MSEYDIFKKFIINGKGNFYCKENKITVFKSKAYVHKDQWRIMNNGEVGKVFYEKASDAFKVIAANAAYFGFNQ